MDGKGFSSTVPVPTKPSAIPRFSSSDAKGINENGIGHDQMNSKVQKPKKPSAKQFMAPTISAASKAVVPRRKILVYKNDASKTPSIDHADQSSSPLTPLYNYICESNDDEKEIFVADSTSKPYDPSTNYLSPRPKYRLFNSKRHSEILRRQEYEIGEGNDGFGIKRSSSIDHHKAVGEEESSGDACPNSSSQEGSIKQENEEIDRSEDDQDNEEEEIEEFKEEREWGLQGVSKILLVFVSLFLSASYISSMNSPSPSFTQQAIWGLMDGYQRIHNQISEAVTIKLIEIGGGSWKQRRETHMSLAEVNQGRTGNGFEGEEMAEDSNIELVEGMISEGYSDQNLKKPDFSELLLWADIAESQVVCDMLPRAENVDSKGAIGSEFEHKGGCSDLHRTETAERCQPFSVNLIPLVHDLNHHDTIVDVPSAFENEKKIILNSKVQQMNSEDNVKIVEGVFHERKEVIEFDVGRVEGNASDEVDESLTTEHLKSEDIIELQMGRIDCNASDAVDEILDVKHLESEFTMEPVEGIPNEVAGKEAVEFFTVKRTEGIVSDAADEIATSQMVNKENSEDDAVIPATEVKLEEVPVKHVGIEWTTIVVSGALILLTVLASPFFIHRSSQKKSQLKDSLPMAKLFTGSVIREKVGRMLATKEGERIEKDESVVNHLSSFQSHKEVSKELHHIAAPRMELLGDASSSCRHCGMKREMIETEDIDTSVSQHKGSWTDDFVIPTQARPSLTEFSDADSSSYGSIIGETKIVRKELKLNSAEEMSHCPIHRRCGMKSKMVETEEIDTSVSQHKGSWTDDFVIPTQAQPSVMEFPDADSPSCGSFIDETKIVKKEEVVNTPVRRSIRIRNRTVMSQ